MAKWWMDALCRDNPDFFDFPDLDEKEQISKSRKICNQCPVKAECFVSAYRDQTREGLWAGTLTIEDRNLVASISGISLTVSFDDSVDKMRQKYSH